MIQYPLRCALFCGIRKDNLRLLSYLLLANVLRLQDGEAVLLVRSRFKMPRTDKKIGESKFMSLLTVENLSHTFGDRVLFRDVSFRLLAGERVGLVGANGTGKSTLMNILTGKQLKDEGRVEWTPKIRYGYLDQHTKLEAGKTIRDALRDAFAPLLELENELNQVTAAMGEPDADLDALLERMGEIQEELEIGDYYLLDVKVEEMANGLGLMRSAWSATLPH